MLPVKKPVPHYRTLEEIQLRKDELLDDLQRDNEKFTKLWDHIFTKQESTSKADYIAGLVSNGFIAVDAFLMARKLIKNYGFLFGIKKRKK
jgi:hypothetical protein